MQFNHGYDSMGEGSESIPEMDMELEDTFDKDSESIDDVVEGGAEFDDLVMQEIRDETDSLYEQARMDEVAEAEIEQLEYDENLIKEQDEVLAELWHQEYIEQMRTPKGD